jgi:hypothetical protein
MSPASLTAGRIFARDPEKPPLVIENIMQINILIRFCQPAGSGISGAKTASAAEWQGNLAEDPDRVLFA